MNLKYLQFVVFLQKKNSVGTFEKIKTTVSFVDNRTEKVVQFKINQGLLEFLEEPIVSLSIKEFLY